MLWDAVIEIAGKVLDRAIPDPQAKAEAKLKLFELQATKELEQLKAETELAVKQIEVNALDAQANDPFQRRWRPAVGWVCVFALAYEFLVQPLLAWGSSIRAFPAPPTLPMGDLITLLLGMLGLGALRTTEKLQDRH